MIHCTWHGRRTVTLNNVNCTGATKITPFLIAVSARPRTQTDLDGGHQSQVSIMNARPPDFYDNRPSASDDDTGRVYQPHTQVPAPRARDNVQGFSSSREEVSD